MYNHDPCHCHAAVIFRRTVDVVLKLASTTVVFCSNAIICLGVSRKSGTAMAVVAVAVPTPLIILWLHSLSGVIRSLLCNPRAFSPAIIIKWVELARNRNKWLGRIRHSYIRAVHARYHARTCAQIRKRCGIVT